jgi:hypothetical protein
VWVQNPYRVTTGQKQKRQTPLAQAAIETQRGKVCEYANCSYVSCSYFVINYTKANHEEMLKYHFQMELILQHIFSPIEKRARKDPKNWMYRMTNLVGGIDFQHAHADQGWPNEYEGEHTFPFVATHGFGVHPFELWLLPKGARGKQDYGILHVFPPTAMVFMRGDFVHAGGTMWLPRCHMKFYPRVEAGLVQKRKDKYWLLPTFNIDISHEAEEGKEEISFLWQHYIFPFALPKTVRQFNEKLQVEEEIIKFPSDLTRHVMDHLHDQGVVSALQEVTEI